MFRLGELEPIKYLTWTRSNWGTIKYDLADSSAFCAPKEIYNDLAKEDFSANTYRRSHKELTEIIAKRYNIPSSKIFLVYGTTLGFFLIFSAIIEPGDEVILETPNYEPIYRAVKLHTRNIKVVERTFDKKFQVDVEQLERKISENTKVIIISNLHNPSGVATNKEKLEIISRIARDNGAYLLCYEIFTDQYFGDKIPTTAGGDNVITISSFARTCALKGIKLGWICANEDVIAKIKLIESYTSVDISYPSIIAALALAKKIDELLPQSREKLKHNFNIVKGWVESRKDITWVPPDGGTMAFIKLLRGIDSMELVNILQKEYETLVVPGDFFWAKGFIRISFGMSPEILQRGLQNISEVLNRLSQ